MSGGITLCPHCGTRFRISTEQLSAHQGMVRCGRCHQVFDAQRDYVPDSLDVQPEVPVVEMVVEQPEPQPVQQPVVTEAAADEVVAAEVAAAVSAEEPDHYVNIDASGLAVVPEEQITMLPDRFAPPRRNWLWNTATLVLVIAVLGQASYLFRVELAARLPGLKPALEGYCRLLDCTVPLPQEINLIDIESSALEADPADENNITLNALLRNKARYAQAFPSLELTLNDAQDKPLARRIFHPAEYLPASESETAGLGPNDELAIKLQLDIASLKPMGYRLALFYPQ